MSPEEIINQITERVKETANVDVVFGAAVVSGGVTVIPVASVKVAGGGGGGRGRDVSPVEGEDVSESGMGVGLHVTARPLGYIEIKDGSARLVPIPDVTKIAIGGMIAGTLALMTVAKLLTKRAKFQSAA